MILVSDFFLYYIASCVFVALEKTSDSINANLHIWINYCSFLRQQKMNQLVFIDRLTHSKFILPSILKKILMSLSCPQPIL